jgi:hypothetical protein
MKVGDYVYCESKLSSTSGFREITAACVECIDEHKTDGHTLVVVVPHATYAYHVSAPELGRYVPPRKIDCFALDELSPCDGTPARQIALMRVGR